MDSIDNLRSELQRALIEFLRPEFQALHREIADIATQLRHARRKNLRNRTDLRKEAIAKLIQQTPKITNLRICRDMDRLQEKSADYAPLPSWNCRLWQDAYYSLTNRVHAYLGAIRREERTKQT